MANTKPALQAQITIDSTNKYIDVSSEDGGVELITATAATYDDIHALCSHLQTLFQALGGNWAATTVTTSDEGVVTIHSNQAAKWVRILWKTGVHGSDNADDHMGDVLGFVDTADDMFAYYYYGEYQHQYGWYPNRYPVRMGPWKPQAVGGELRHTLSGTNSKKLHVAFHHTYSADFSMIAPERTFTAEATSTNLNKDLEHVWEAIANGDFGTWYTDASDTGSGTKCYLLSPFDWDGSVTRPHTDYKAYDISLKFREQES